MGTERSASSPGMASAEHTNYDHMASPRAGAEAKDGGAGDKLAALMQGLMGAQANDSGWATFSGKYVEYT
jgi:hypothetical protein